MRIAVISDIHEDLEYLEKALDQIAKLGSDLICCLGDIVGFSSNYYTYEKSRNASACLQLIREKCELVIPGNHDLSACSRIPEHSAVFDYPGNWYDISIVERRDLSADKLWLHEDDLDPGLSQEDLEYLYALPEFAPMEIDNYNVLFSHYASPNLSGMKKGFYTWKDEFNAHFEIMSDQDCSIAITGHAHPDGMIRVTKNRFSQLYFDKWVPLKKFPVLFIIPAVHRQRDLAGFCMIDTDYKELSAIRIK